MAAWQGVAMGWDVRRFADEARKSTVYDADDTTLLWLTRDAISRLESAREHDILEYRPLPYDRTLMVGFASPLELPNGSAAWLIVRAPTSYLAELNQRAERDWDDMSREQRATARDVIREIEEQGKSGERTVAAFQVSGSLVGYVPINAETVSEQPFDADPSADLAPTISANMLHGEESAQLRAALRAAWTVYTDPTESDAAAVDVQPSQVTLGSKRKARNVPLQVVDIRRESGGGGKSGQDGEPLKHDFRWRVSGHPRWQWYGSGDGRHQRKIWIAGHVRGPVGKPIKPRVDVVRGRDVSGG